MKLKGKERKTAQKIMSVMIAAAVIFAGTFPAPSTFAEDSATLQGNAGQAAIASETEKPVITFVPNTTPIKQQDYTVTASVYESDGVPNVTLSYEGKDGAFVPVSLTSGPNVDGTAAYSGVIPKTAMNGRTSLSYYLEANNGTSAVRSPEDPSSFYTLNIEPVEGKGPYLLITEIVSNARAAGKDLPESWEYVELYNNSNRTVPLNEYKVLYGYPNLATAPVQLDLKTEKMLQPGETVVLWNWIEGSSGDLAGFNANYGTSLTEDQIIRFGNYNFKNDSGRSVSIATDAGEVIATARYNDSADGSSFVESGTHDNLDHSSIIYKAHADGNAMMAKIGSKVKPATPGILLAEQQPEAGMTLPEDFLKPTVEHERPFSSTVAEDLVLTAKVRDDQKLESVKLMYKKVDAPEFTSMPMTLSNVQDVYGALLTKDKLLGAGMILYYFEAADGANTVRYPANNTLKFQVTDTLQPVASPLLITEVLPDNKGGDAYEYVEVYNNTNRSIQLKDYHIRYTSRYGDYVAWDIKTDTVIPAQQTGLIWVQSVASKDKPVTDFLSHHKISFDSSRVAVLFADGMSNSEEGRIVLATDAGEIVSQAWFSIAEDQAFDDGTSIVYEYPQDGGNRMVERGFKQVSTPGQLLSGQVPAEAIQLEADTEQPVITHSAAAYPQARGNLSLETTVTDNGQVKKVALFYKRSNETEYRSVNMSRTSDHVYKSEDVLAQHFLNAEAVDYYFEATDGFQTASSLSGNGGQPYQLKYETSEQAPLQINLQNGEIISGKKRVSGASQDPAAALTLEMDGLPLSTSKTMQSDAFLLLEVNDMQASFKNGLYINGEYAALLPGSSKYIQIAIPLAANLLRTGSNTITLTAGNGKGPTEQEGNNDDFTIQSVQVVLWNGDKLAIESGRILNANGSYTNVDLNAPRTAIGDGSSNDAAAKQLVEYTVTLPVEAFNAVSAEIDTAALLDGEHTLLLSSDSGTAQSKIIVDNTAPVIAGLSLEEGKVYRDTLSLAADASDAVSGIASITGTLDGQQVAVPSTMKIAGWKEGTHEFQVTVTDKAGNVSEESVTFLIETENPEKPSEPAPADKASETGTNPNLSVKVTDPNGDAMDVTFYKGYRYDFSETSTKAAYWNATDREPPLELTPAGETPMTPAEIAQLSKLDGDYFTNNDQEKFPYQRFDFTVAGELAADSEVEVVWQGHSMPGRQVTLYTWNYNTEVWERAASGVGETDFELRAKVNVGNMVRNQIVHVLVQDLIPSAQEKFTFAWISDTQYYSDSYPYIYKSMTQYIANQKDIRNIAYSVHTGDLVDDWDRPDEWKTASDSQKVLEDAGVPYGVVAGNHDVNHEAADYMEYYKYFGKDRYEDQPYYGDSPNNNRDHYDLISASGQDFIIMYFGWGIEADTIKWANEVLAKYPDRHAIIATHEYISASGAYSGDGEKIWTEVVANNPNVFMVLCGHIHGAAYNVKHAPDGRVVVEMLADYQSGQEGGGGFIRFLEFDTANEKIHVSTYSPYKNDENYYEDPGHDNFDLPFLPIAPDKQVATDYIGLNVYTKELIGSQKQVASGSRASVNWLGLAGEQTYSWYAAAADPYGGTAVSDIWSLSTGKSIVNGGDGGNGTVDPGNGSYGPDTLVVKAAAIADPDGDGKVTVTLSEGQRSVLFTADALQQLTNINLTIKNGEDNITLPGAYFTAFLSKYSKGDQLLVSIKAANASAAQQAHLGKAGSSVEVTIAVVQQDGKTAAMEQLESKAVLSLEANEVRNSRLAAIYLIGSDGSLQRVESRLENGIYAADISKPGIYAVLEYNKPFVDLAQTHWAFDYIQELSFHEVINGVDADHYKPGTATTRAEFVKLIAGVLGLKPSGTAESFSDVKKDIWYEDAIMAAVEAGIIQGSGDGKFDPNRRITREEMAVILVNAYQFKNGSSTGPGSGSPAFKDASQISEWARQAATQAAALGFLEGQGGGLFAPDKQATRAEGAKVIYMLMEAVK